MRIVAFDENLESASLIPDQFILFRRKGKTYCFNLHARYCFLFGRMLFKKYFFH